MYTKVHTHTSTVFVGDEKLALKLLRTPSYYVVWPCHPAGRGAQDALSECSGGVAISLNNGTDFQECKNYPKP